MADGADKAGVSERAPANIGAPASPLADSCPWYPSQEASEAAAAVIKSRLHELAHGRTPADVIARDALRAGYQVDYRLQREAQR
jgi:hypothetical protein